MEILSLLSNALLEVTPRILRDFDELRYLQSSIKLPFNFAQSSYEKIKENLIHHIQKTKLEASLYLDNGEEIYNTLNAKYKLILNPMDGFPNYSRSLNNFAINLLIKKINNQESSLSIPTFAAIIYLPSIGELYHAQLGGGAWLKIKEDFFSKAQRLRVSTIKDEYNILVDTVDSFQKSPSQNCFITNCASLNIAYIAAAKADLAILNKSPFLFDIATLFLKETGGHIKEEENLLILSNKKP